MTPPTFAITIHPNGRATILMNGELLRWTTGFSIEQDAASGQPATICIRFVAETIQLNGPLVLLRPEAELAG